MARPARHRGNMPAEATSFVGRRRELADLKRKLSSARLVSLVGPGGVGKTRLAIRAAAEVSRSFPGGAWLVELADVRDPALVGNAVVAALDLRDQAAAAPVAGLIADGLSNKQIGARQIHLGTYRRQPRPQHPQQARLQLTRADRALDRIGGTALGAAVEPRR
jgi:ATP/maltotriose-dependent transcriptional regulator MalT